MQSSPHIFHLILNIHIFLILFNDTFGRDNPGMLTDLVFIEADKL